jgi:hypothetical protein
MLAKAPAAVSPAWIAVALALAVSQPALAQGDPCLEAYVGAQRLRKAGKLVAARDAVRTCLGPSCPVETAGECAKWLAEIEASLPTVVFEARDERGQDLAEIRVTVDGAPMLERLDGVARPIDPGPHVVGFELPDGRRFERTIVVREGEKNRRVAVLPPPTPASVAEPPATAPPPAAAASSPPAPEAEGPSVAWPLGFVTGGVGMVALGLFAGFGIAALDEHAELASSCAPRCSPDQVNALGDKQLVADVSLGIGVGLVAAGAILLAVGWPRTPAPDAEAQATRRTEVLW